MNSTTKSRRAARPVAARDRVWESPTGAVRDSGARYVNRALRKADRLIDEGDSLGARDLLLEQDQADERAEARIYGRRLRTWARLYSTAFESGRDGTACTQPGMPGMSVDFAMREAASEVAANGRITSGHAAKLLDEAFRFVTRFDATVCALEDGEITKAHAQKILTIGSPVEDDARRAEFERIVLEAAATKTPWQLETFATRIVQQFMSTSLDERFQEAVKKRYVAIVHVEDGMAYLTAFIPSVLAAGIHGHLTAAGKQEKRVTAMAIADAKERGDVEGAAAIEANAPPIDQLRADILCSLALTTDLATGGNPYGTLASLNANIDVTVSTGALAEHLMDGTMSESHATALLNGRLPVPVATARELLSTCTSFTRVQTDPFSRMVTSVDTRYANKRMKDFLRIRDAHCRWPGCTLPAVRCELDHTIAVEDGGPTTLSNLEFLCKGHHLLKHQSRWQAEQLEGGVMKWTSPTGRVFMTAPEPADPDCFVGRPPGPQPPGEESAVMANEGPPEFQPTDADPPPF